MGVGCGARIPPRCAQTHTHTDSLFSPLIPIAPSPGTEASSKKWRRRRA